MKRTAIVIETSRFPAEWPEAPDSDPPPGRDFAQALLKSLLDSGMTSTPGGLTGDDFEHGGWFFCVAWVETNYVVCIAADNCESSPPRWLIDVSKPLGCLGLFARESRRFEVEDAVLEMFERSVKKAAGVDQVTWQTYDDACESFMKPR